MLAISTAMLRHRRHTAYHLCAAHSPVLAAMLRSCAPTAWRTAISAQHVSRLADGDHRVAHRLLPCHAVQLHAIQLACRNQCTACCRLPCHAGLLCMQQATCLADGNQSTARHAMFTGTSHGPSLTALHRSAAPARPAVQEADAAAMLPQPGLVVQEADAAAMPQCTLSHKAQHPVQLSLQAGDPARPEEVVGDTSGSEMEEEPAGKRVRTCALPLRSNAPCCP